MENLIIESGPCGCFQILHISVTQSLRFFVVWSVYFMMFGNFDPGWKCIKSDVIKIGNGTSLRVNMSSNFLANRLIGIGSGDLPSSVEKLNRSLMVLDDVSETSWNPYNGTCDIIDTCDEIMFNPVSSTIVSEFGLICDKTWVISLIIFVSCAGFMAGSLFWGQIGELYGRKTSLYASAALLAVSNGLAVFSPTWEVYTFFSVLIGIGVVGVVASVTLFGMEYLSAKWRGICASLPIWNVAIIAYAATVMLLKNWMYMHILNAVFTGISCLGYFWASESPRWLAVHGQKEQAIKVIIKISRYNKKPMPDMEIIETLSQNDQRTAKKYTYLDLFKTWKVAVIMAKLSTCLISLNLAHSLLGFSVSSLPGDFYTNLMLVACADFPGVLIVGNLSNKIGRRLSLFGFSALGTVCFCITVVSCLCIDDPQVKDTAVKTLAIIGRGSMTAVLTMVIPFAVELLPTVVRSVGLGFLFTVSRTGGLVAAFLLPHDNASFILAYGILSATGVIACVSYLSLPETNKKPMSDTLEEARSSAEEETLTDKIVEKI